MAKIELKYVSNDTEEEQKEAEKNGTSVNTTTEFTVSEQDDDLPF